MRSSQSPITSSFTSKATSTPPHGQGPNQEQITPTGKWLTALIRASSELLETYMVGGQPTQAEGLQPLRSLLVGSHLHGATRGQVRCHIDRDLALAVAEGMWGEPIAALNAQQIEDSLTELCGQIIGYAAGEVSAQYPGVLFDPPEMQEDRGEEAPLPGGDRALVPTRLGALRWEVSGITVATEERRPSQHALSVRDRIQGMRDTDLPLMQALQVLAVDDRQPDSFEQLLRAVGTDPPLTARIIRRVNSAMLKPGTELRTLRQALLYLGTRAAKNIVVSALLAQPSGSLHAPPSPVVMHSIRTAVLAKQLAPMYQQDGDECYLLGLLHDLGRLVLDRLYPVEQGRFAHLCEETLLEKELHVLGITHPEAGAIIAVGGAFQRRCG